MAMSVIFCHTSIEATAPTLHYSVFCTITFTIVVKFVKFLLSCLFVLRTCVNSPLFPQVVLGNVETGGGLVQS